MIENEPAQTKTGANSPDKPTAPRASRSIRFSDSEWWAIENAAQAREMTAAEFVRHAAVSLATRKLGSDSPPIPPEILAQLERIYRGVYLLSTLKRDEMIRDGRQDEFDRVRQDAQDSQISIHETASRTAG
ncbi:MAG: hypothetical protein OXM03_04405 [Chloroflexota bacterium]|nr:hypothetical protein [Caldilineaceae bacterium]MDE0455179.1 hypothetical protein [Gammaproteobacteria bacterium]MDE2839850.1 hypothetical protein [Chloroflexota bacterium]